jgi:tetratricopeptide (TPR) repeat protein
MLWRLRGKPARAIRALALAASADPQSAHLRVARARSYLRLGQFRKARSELDRAAKLRPSFAGIYLVRAWMAIYERQFKQAQKHLIRAMRLAPKWPRVYRLLARLHRARGDGKREARVYRFLLRLDPDDVEAWMALAASARRQRRNLKASRILKALLKAHPWEVNARIALSYVWLELGKNRQAVRELEEAVNLSDDDPEVALSLWRLLLMRGEVSKAKALLKRLQANAAPEYLSFAATRLKELGLARQAEAAANKALAMDRGYSGALVVLSELALLRGDFARALALALRAVKRKKRLAGAVQKLARVFLVWGRCGKGDAQFARLLRANPTSVPVLTAWAELQARCGQKGGLGFARMKRRVRQSGLDARMLTSWALIQEAAGQWQSAVKVAQTLLRLDPDDVQALNFIGYTLAERGKGGNKAVRMLVRAQRLSPLDPYVMDSLGLALLMVGKLRKAGVWLDRARRMLPLEPEVLGHVGDHRALTNRRGEALRLYKLALQRAPMPRIRRSIERKVRMLEHRKSAQPTRRTVR